MKKIIRILFIFFCFGLTWINAQSSFKFITDPALYKNAPDSLSKTGFYSDIVKKIVGTGIYAYDVNSPGWHSGAVSEHFVTVPSGQKISVKNERQFDFPPQTTFIQNLIYTKNNQKQYLETRIMVLKFDIWYVFPYRWNNAQTDAKLALDYDQKDTVFTIGNDKLPWRYPSQDGCWKCHIKGTPQILSFVPPQLNRISSKTGSQNQLAYFSQIGLLSGTVPDSKTMLTWAGLNENTVSLEIRARSYFATNCAGCHSVENRPFFTGSPVYGNQDLSYFTKSMPMNYLNLLPDLSGLYGDSLNLRVIYPNKPDSSLSLIRIKENSMPFGGFVTVSDTLGLSILKQWVSELSVSISKPSIKLFRSGPRQWGNAIYIPNQNGDLSRFDLHGKHIKRVKSQPQSQ